MIRAILLLLIATSLYGQKDNQYQLALNAVTTATASTPLRNVGQVQHAVWVKATVCSLSGSSLIFPIMVQGSYDNATWFNIGSASSNLLPTAQTGLLFATGAYPYIRVNYYQTVAGCTVTAWYTGNISSFETLTQSSLYTTFTGAVSDATATIGVVAAPPGVRFVVYGMVLYATTNTNKITVNSKPTSCANPSSTVFLTSVPITSTGEPFVLGNGGAPWYSTVPGEILCLSVDATGVGAWWYSVIGRYE